jgi:hypothetical protein
MLHEGHELVDEFNEVVTEDIGEEGSREGVAQ